MKAIALFATMICDDSSWLLPSSRAKVTRKKTVDGVNIPFFALVPIRFGVPEGGLVPKMITARHT